MKLYLLTVNYQTGYDEYDSCVVCAENEDDAKCIKPNGSVFIEDDYCTSWAFSKNKIICEEIGTANENQEHGVICASFRAG